MKRRQVKRMLREISSIAIASDGDLPKALRMCVRLGATSGSEELRAWADHELRGWDFADELPEYRKLTAPLFIDGENARGVILRQTLTADFLDQEHWSLLTDDLRVTDSIATISELIKGCRRKGETFAPFSPPGDGMLLTLINAKLNSGGPRTQHVSRVYWAAALSVLDGVTEAVRAHLLTLVSVVEVALRSKDPEAVRASAANYVNGVVIHGHHNNVTINQTASAGRWSLAWLGDRPKGFWAKVMLAAGVVAALARMIWAIAGG